MHLAGRHPRARRSRAAAAALLVVAGWIGAGCVGRPPADAHGPWATAQRIAAIDFGRDTIEQRTEHRELLERWLANAAARPRDWTRLPEQLRAEALRARVAAGDIQRAAAFELHRRPTELPPLLPGSHELTQNLVESGDAVARWLWPDQPLGEIDDQRHRTRYDDDHPEATVLQRLMRRLRL